MSGWLDKCHFGDVRDVLRQMIADGIRVDTIVTSPPYWGLRDYGHDGQIGLEPTLAEFIATMVDVFNLCRQVLRDDGTAWVNMGDSYASGGGAGAQGCAGQRASRTHTQPNLMGNTSAAAGLKPKDLVGQPWRLAFALQDAGWYLRQDIIWHKPNPMPESVRDRCTKAHEYIFLLAKAPRYYFDGDAIKEPVSGTANPRRAEGVGHRSGPPGNPPNRKLAPPGGGTKNNTSMDAALAKMPSTRTKRSVWTVGSEPYSGAHFATFPTALIEPCILAGSRPFGVVLDPFFGSGTTGQVAQALGRHFIGIEINEDYAELQRERLRQPSLFLEAAA